MGFFSDLKEDLSQAVNELLQESESIKTQTVETQEEALSEADKGDVSQVSLEELLENIDNVKLPEEEPAEEAISDEVLNQWLNEALESRKAEAANSMETASEEVIPETDDAIPETDDAIPETDDAKTDVFMADILVPKDSVEAEEADFEAEVSNTGGLEEEAETVEETEQMEVNTNRVAADENAVITAGMTVTGDVFSAGSIDLLGEINGNIEVYGKLNISGRIVGNAKASEIYVDGAMVRGEVESTGSVKVGAGAVIIGNITATSTVIAGAVKGDIDVKGPVILDTSAVVMGNIKSKSVQINNGAVVEGMCSQCYSDVRPASFFE